MWFGNLTASRPTLPTHRLGAAILGHTRALPQGADLLGRGACGGNATCEDGFSGSRASRRRRRGPRVGVHMQEQASGYKAARNAHLEYDVGVLFAWRESGGGEEVPAFMPDCCSPSRMLKQRPACPQPPTQLTKCLGVPQLDALQQVDLQLARLARHPAAPARTGRRRRRERRRPWLGGPPASAGACCCSMTRLQCCTTGCEAQRGQAGESS